jgi:hypothetical protein
MRTRRSARRASGAGAANVGPASQDGRIRIRGGASRDRPPPHDFAMRPVDRPAMPSPRLSRSAHREREVCSAAVLIEFGTMGTFARTRCDLTDHFGYRSGERMKSTHPLAIALAGMSGCPAVSSLCAIVTPPTSLISQSASAPSPSKPETMMAISLPFQC